MGPRTGGSEVYLPSALSVPAEPMQATLSETIRRKSYDREAIAIFKDVGVDIRDGLTPGSFQQALRNGAVKLNGLRLGAAPDPEVNADAPTACRSSRVQPVSGQSSLPAGFDSQAAGGLEAAVNNANSSLVDLRNSVDRVEPIRVPTNES